MDVWDYREHGSPVEKVEAFWNWVKQAGLVRMFDRAPSGEPGEPGYDPGEHGAERVDWSVPRAIAADGSHLTLIGMTDRPGVAHFCHRFEHEGYLPGTKYNRDFDLFYTVWNAGMVGPIFWMMLFIPLKDKSYAEETAKEFELKLTAGIPRLFRHKDVKGLTGLGTMRDVTLKRSPELEVIESFPLGAYPNSYALESPRLGVSGIGLR